ncbi:hypothetical protein [Pseudomonas marincola]|nr:hypothetical protein [Pseudomonas marincola]SFT49546.1 hypothetical protein SAMN05216264_101613 [Pseudomonas marincola]
MQHNHYPEHQPSKREKLATLTCSALALLALIAIGNMGPELLLGLLK